MPWWGDIKKFSVDKNKNIYVSVYGSHNIQKWDASNIDDGNESNTNAELIYGKADRNQISMKIVQKVLQNLNQGIQED